MENGSNSYTGFIQDIINGDLESGRYDSVHTRFPPEPNGYLHIGHAKAVCINFGIAAANAGLCNLRFDDTNPSREESRYVESIKEDIRWLGFDWGDRLFFASDYFDRLYMYAEQLIEKGLAYVCDLDAERIREYRGTLTEPGTESPYRNRSTDENMFLFRNMRNGKYSNGERVLRAKIDMSSPNLNLRDPVIYRIQHSNHHRTGSKWCIYPMYDFAHPLSDAIEGITHSLCSIEFEDHRPLYEWYLEKLEIPNPPRQIEFARLNLSYTIMSKRMLLKLVEGGFVESWDDPRMPSISGLRRLGYTPGAIRDFCNRIGVAKTFSTVDIALLEHCIRDDLNMKARRVMVVSRPLKVILENYPEGKEEFFEIENNPEDSSAGVRKVPFSKELYIEQSDFMEDPPKRFFRLSPGKEVRLKNAYFIKCTGVIRDENSEITGLICTYDPETRGGSSPDGRKVKGTIHWVSASHACSIQVRLYDRLFDRENPCDAESEGDFTDNINQDSLEVLENCKAEPDLCNAEPESRYQFFRLGYFCADKNSHKSKPVFNRTVTLRDTWAKIQKKNKS